MLKTNTAAKFESCIRLEGKNENHGGRRTHNGLVGPIPVDLEVEEATKPSHRQIQSQNKIKTATFFFNLFCKK